jgi:hypothetical protein
MTTRTLALTLAAMVLVGGGVYLYSAASSSEVAAPSRPASAAPGATAEAGGSTKPSPDPDRRAVRRPVRSMPPSAQPMGGAGADGDGDGEIAAASDGPTGAPRPRIDLRGRVIQRADREPAPTPGITTTDREPVPERPDPDPEIEARMQETAALFDRKDYAAARGMALKVLAAKPGSARMLRVAVAASCLLGDAAAAQQHAAALPEADRAELARRCAEHGVAL